MSIGLLLYVFPTMFYTWQMYNPYYERQTIDRYGYDQERQVLIDVARLKSNYDMDFMATADTAAGVIMWVVMLIVYFVPFVIAHHRRSKNCAAVLVINLFLGCH